jgi:acetoin:2,6-dichlorophenolindophenol oxidoreductase subunit beta
MVEMTFAQAVRSALAAELARDPAVFLLGEDIGRHGGVFKATDGLLAEFGATRVRDTPISELGVTAAAVGSALAGMRPVVEIMFGDFTTLALDQLVNEAAKMRYMTGGQVRVPITVRTTLGTARSAAAQHSQTLYAWYAHVPGLRVVVPSTPADARGLLQAAIRDDNPAIVFEDKSLYAVKGEVPDDGPAERLGQAIVRRAGTDVTIIALARMVHFALQAADELEAAGISAEVVDPRCLSPLDTPTLVQSAIKTRRVVVADPAVQSYGAAAELASRVYEGAFDYLDAPVRRVCSRDVPIPFSPALERGVVPGPAEIKAAALELVG